MTSSTKERLLVCVSPDTVSKQLVRAGQQLAACINAEWFAAYVETPGTAQLPTRVREQVNESLGLAESLGAQAITIPGNSVAEAIGRFARMRQITRIVVGKPQHTRWDDRLHRSVVDQILRQSGRADLYVIHNTGEPSVVNRPGFHPDFSDLPWRPYLISLVLVLASTLAGLPLRLMIDPPNLMMLYLTAVILAALYLGRYPAILTAILSVATFNYIFVPPYYTNRPDDAEYLLTFAVFLVVGVVVSTLAARASEQAHAAQQREAQTAILYELSRGLGNALDEAQIAQTVSTKIQELFHRRPTLFLSRPKTPQPQATVSESEQKTIEREQRVITWVFENGQPAGQGTNILAWAEGFYLPLRTAHTTLGVLGIYFAPNEKPLSPAQRRLLTAFADQCAQAIERLRLAARARQAQLLQETERLQTALLNSISHDLRTPLATITGALSSLQEDALYLDEATQHTLVQTAREQADRLNNLVGNLLDMTRLEAGAMQIRREPGDLHDVVVVALNQLSQQLADRPVQIETTDPLPLVPIDFVLMVQVLVNLLANAINYSPPDTPITIRLTVDQTEVLIEVADQGCGIPAEALPHIFEKFYRIPHPGRSSGTGLGLSISQGIVEAHQGRIWARNREGRGTVMTVALPIELKKDLPGRQHDDPI